MYSNPNDIVFNPYAAINPRSLSSLALCWDGNRLAGCDGFTPNTKINFYPSGVFHGQSGSGVRFIPLAGQAQAQAQSPHTLLTGGGVPNPGATRIQLNAAGLAAPGHSHPRM